MRAISGVRKSNTQLTELMTNPIPPEVPEIHDSKLTMPSTDDKALVTCKTTKIFNLFAFYFTSNHVQSICKYVELMLKTKHVQNVLKQLSKML